MLESQAFANTTLRSLGKNIPVGFCVKRICEAIWGWVMGVSFMFLSTLMAKTPSDIRDYSGQWSKALPEFLFNPFFWALVFIIGMICGLIKTFFRPRLPIYFGDNVMQHTHYAQNTNGIFVTYAGVIQSKLKKSVCVDIEIRTTVLNSANNTLVYSDFSPKSLNIVQSGKQKIDLICFEALTKSRVNQFRLVHKESGKVIGLRVGDKFKFRIIFTLEGFKEAYEDLYVEIREENGVTRPAIFEGKPDDWPALPSYDVENVY